MRRRKSGQWGLIAASAAVLLFIWGNSLLPATTSSAISGWLSELLSKVLRRMGVAESEGALRKLTHMAEFAALGAVLAQARAQFAKPWSLVFLGGIAVALIDETLQLVVDGRSSQVLDIWIDLAGFCLGALAVAAIWKLWGRRGSRKPSP